MSAVDLEITADRAGVAESGMEIPVGTTCKYMGHMPGGGVKVEMPDGSYEIVSPHLFPALR